MNGFRLFVEEGLVDVSENSHPLRTEVTTVIRNLTKVRYLSEPGGETALLPRYRLTVTSEKDLWRRSISMPLYRHLPPTFDARMPPPLQ